MPMDWDKLRIFHKVAKAGSFTHAADTLHLSQSAISRQISSLEDMIGTPLFHRHARGLILTEQGEILFEAADEMASKLGFATSRLTESKQAPAGPLRVTTTVGLGSAWLAVRLERFLDKYPDIEVELILSNDELDIAMREADCAVRLRQPQQPDLIQRRLFTVHFHVYASPQYLERFGTPETPEDLNDHRIVVWGEEAPGYLRDVNWLLFVGLQGGESRRAALKINSLLAIKRAVERHAGLAVLPDYSIAEETPLVRVMSEMTMPSFDTYFAYSSELRNSARLNAFREFLLSEASEWDF